MGTSEVDEETRRKCSMMLSKAFSSNADSPTEAGSADKAAEIERAIFVASRGVAEYSMLFKSKYLNLKDASNKWLCNLVYSGTIGPENYVRMTTEQMKSQELREFEAEVLERSLLDSQVAKQEAETDMFFCTKCKQRKCTYRQLQTRSADEPMTTYVYCVSCGNTWKFS